MAYKGMVVEVKRSMLHPHPNADKLQLLRTNGYTIIVGLDLQEGDVGILFGTDTPGKLEPMFLTENDLYARRDSEGKNVSQGFFKPSGRVTSVNIRGVKSEGYFHVFRHNNPNDDEGYAGDKMTVSDVKRMGYSPNDVIDTFCGQLICSKYYVPSNRRVGGFTGGNKASSADKVLMPNLARHYDTEQLRHHIHSIPVGAILRITLKLHGTSGRTGHVLTPPSRFERILAYLGLEKRTYAYQSGTRKMALIDERSNFISTKDAFSATRFKWHEYIKRQGLPKGVTLYYEIVGYGETGKPIMSPHYSEGDSLNEVIGTVDINNEPTGERVLVPRVSDNGKIEYHYGLKDGTNQSEVYVYRITQRNEDGHTVEYSYEQVCDFCDKRDLKVVPNIGNDYAGMIWDGDIERFIKWLETFCAFPDPLGKDHPMEGVVIKVEHPEWFGPKALKYKGRLFVELEGNAYNNGLPDVEEES